ncbi:DUF4190 domain-containing protein [Actinoplanes sp. NPDC049118]|uniref:DUF4190 domain-containing protein n=1 Tax=Actinoplanes sp. NPDC049118 TaxID=3155769 RepID=UPI0033FF1F8D
MNEGLPGYPVPPLQQRPPGSPAPGLNGFAVASLVCGIVGLGAAFGVVFGIIAIAQISRRGGRGLGLAIAGICLSALWGIALALVLIVTVSGYLSGAAGTATGGPPSGTPSSPPPIAPANAAEGECILRLDPELAVAEMSKIACHKPHQAEVYLVFDLKLWPYPGDTKVDAAAENRCRREFPGYGIGQFSNGEMFYEFPAESVYADSRWVTCVAYAATGTWTGQLPG